VQVQEWEWGVVRVYAYRNGNGSVRVYVKIMGIGVLECLCRNGNVKSVCAKNGSEHGRWKWSCTWN